MHCLAELFTRLAPDGCDLMWIVQAYEARFNPFAEFQQAEEASHVRALPAHDRALLTGSK